MPGPTDENGQSLLTASPLYGVRQWRPGQASDQQFLSDLSNSFTGRRGMLQMDPQQLQRMREEISVPAEGEGDQRQEQQPAGGNTLESRPLSSAAQGQDLNSPQLGAQGLNGAGADTQQRTRTRILAPPEQQTPQYAEMRRRLDQYNKDRRATDQEAHQAFVQAQRARENAAAQPGQTAQGQRQQQPGGASAAAQAAPGTGATPAPGAAPAPGTATPTAEQSNAERLGLTDHAKRTEEMLRGDKPAPGDEKEQPAAQAKRAPRPEPVRVPSLAEGAQAKGLTELLLKAEALMKDGKFTSALDEYDKAEQVAPNNPLIRLGRANAELGAGYYSRAESHLREAFTADPALLIGQYDLRSFYGEDRLRTLVNDLKDISRVEERQSRPVFLLAYIAYNSGNERMAAGYLDLAEKRAGANDPLFKLIRDHWKLPDDAPAADVEGSTPAAPQDLNK
jgi:tetratricopeptide (TPR) repeat protein